MDKDIKEMLNELNEILGDNDNKDWFEAMLKKRINKAFKEKASISIEKFEDGRAETHTEGTNIAILIALAGLEKAVLEKLDPPMGVWELIKDKVGIKEVVK